MWQTQTGSYMDCDLWSNSYGDCSLITCRENSDYASSDVPAARAHLLLQADCSEGSAPSASTDLVMYPVRLWMGMRQRIKQFVRKRIVHKEKNRPIVITCDSRKLCILVHMFSERINFQKGDQEVQNSCSWAFIASLCVIWRSAVLSATPVSFLPA